MRTKEHRIGSSEIPKSGSGSDLLWKVTENHSRSSESTKFLNLGETFDITLTLYLQTSKPGETTELEITRV